MHLPSWRGWAGVRPKSVLIAPQLHMAPKPSGQGSGPFRLRSQDDCLTLLLRGLLHRLPVAGGLQDIWGW